MIKDCEGGTVGRDADAGCLSPFEYPREGVPSLENECEGSRRMLFHKPEHTVVDPHIFGCSGYIGACYRKESFRRVKVLERANPFYCLGIERIAGEGIPVVGFPDHYSAVRERFAYLPQLFFRRAFGIYLKNYHFVELSLQI